MSDRWSDESWTNWTRAYFAHCIAESNWEWGQEQRRQRRLQLQRQRTDASTNASNDSNNDASNEWPPFRRQFMLARRPGQRASEVLARDIPSTDASIDRGTASTDTGIDTNTDAKASNNTSTDASTDASIDRGTASTDASIDTDTGRKKRKR